MVNLTEKEIKEYSADILRKKTSIEDIDNSIISITRTIQDKFKEDATNRKMLLDKTNLIDGASLEFRNIYGIEPPNFNTTNCSLGLDKNGDGIINKDERITFNGKKTFKDSSIVLNAAMFDSEMKDNDNYYPVDKQSFFVDENKKDASSKFNIPWCPPGLERWAGRYLYENVCKDFPFSLQSLYLLFGDGTKSIPTLSQSLEVGKYCTVLVGDEESGESGPNITYYDLDSDSPIQCNIDENGRLQKNQFYFEPSTKTMENQKTDNVILLPIEHPRDNNPIHWFNYSLIREWSKDLEAYKYNDADGPFGNNDAVLVKYYAREKNEDKPFCSGYAILTVDSSQFRSGKYERPYTIVESDALINSEELESWSTIYNKMRFCMNILTHDGDLSTQETKREKAYYKNFWNWIIRKKEYKTVVNKHKYSLTFEPVNSLNSYNNSENINVILAKLIRNIVNEPIELYKEIKDKPLGFNIDNTIKYYDECILYLDKFINNPTQENHKIASISLGKLFIRSYNENWNAEEWENDDYWSAHKPEGQIEIDATGSITYDGPTDYLNGYRTVLKWEKGIKLVKEPIHIDRKHITISCFNLRRNIFTASKKCTLNQKKEFGGPYPGADISLLSIIDSIIDFILSGGKDNGYDGALSFKDIKDLAKHSKEATNPSDPLYGLYDCLKNLKGGIWQNPNNIENSTYLDVETKDGSYIRLEGNNKRTSELFDVVLVFESGIDGGKKTSDGTFVSSYRANEINKFFEKNDTLYTDAYDLVSSRINKRSGTLREVCSIVNNMNIMAQTSEEKKCNMSSTFNEMAVYYINGVSNNSVDIKLSAWEPDDLAYSSMERLSKIYLISQDNSIMKECTIIEIIELISESITLDKLVGTVNEIKDLPTNAKHHDLYSVLENDGYYVWDNDLKKWEDFNAIGAIFRVKLDEQLSSQEQILLRGGRVVRVF